MSSRTYIRHILRLALATMLAAFAGACTDNSGIDDTDTPPTGAVLRLSTGSSFTRGDEHYGDDEHAEKSDAGNEEAINRVDLFFFDEANSDKQAFYIHRLNKVGQSATADLTVKIPIEMLGKFTDRSAYVYALVNLPDATEVDADKHTIDGEPATLDNLKKVWVDAPEFLGKGIPPTFVMRGGETVGLSGEGKNTVVSGVIRIERLASKIRLWADIPKEIYLDKDGKTLYQFEDENDSDWEARRQSETVETWESVPVGQNKESDVMLYLYNLTTSGRIDGFTGDDGKSATVYNDIDRNEKYKDIVRKLATGVTLNQSDVDSRYPYSHSTAYYSYPNEWDSSTPLETHNTYMIISLPWRKKENGGSGSTGNVYQVCYYQVPVNVLKSETEMADCLTPNRYYRIKIHLGMLGSKDLGSPLEIDASCEVVDWVTEPVDVNIKERRYLVVNQTKWTMNNVHTLQIPFSTSHKAKIEKCYVNYFRYNDVWGDDADNTLNENDRNLTEFKNWVAEAGKLPNGTDGEGLITASFLTRSSTTVGEPEFKYNDRGLSWYPIRDTYKYITYTTKNVNRNNEELYYKKEYFYDDIVGFTYYIGHEHPMMFQLDYVKYPEDDSQMTDEEKAAWTLYNEKYDNINAIYTCEIDHKNSVINFTHPLVQWKDVRSEDIVENGDPDNTPFPRNPVSREGSYLGGYTETYERTITELYDSKLQYYVPEINQRTNNLWDEFSRCEIIIKIKHEDYDNSADGLYEETIYITQYPAMYVEVSHNYGTKCPSYVSNSKREGNEYVKVNGNKTENPADDDANSTEWFEVTSFMTYFGQINNNPNMYVIHTSQLSEENEIMYDIGDPRTLYYNNQLDDDSFTNKDNNVYVGNIDNKNNVWNGYHLIAKKDWFGNITSVDLVANNITIANGKDWYGGADRKLQYYYPTDETTGPGSKENFIAPEFRIASSFGKVSLNYNYSGDSSWKALDEGSKAEARRRCASYQEGGRPAGRWRIPTMAEIKYLVQLSAEGKIPHLFGLQDDLDFYTPYWSSNGLLGVRLRDKDIKELAMSDLTSVPAVRCIYDEWYWNKIDEAAGKIDETTGKKLYPKEETFYWGDRIKDNTQQKK